VHTAAAHLDEEEHVQSLQPNSLNGEEIDREPAAPVRPYELAPGHPPACAGWSETRCPKLGADRRRRNNQAKAFQFADDALGAPMLAEHQIPVTASVGVALFDGLTSIEVLAAADLALYDAKDAGRDRVAVYRPKSGARPRASSRLAEAERIRRALAHDQLELHCQPIIDLANNEVSLKIDGDFSA